MGDKKGPFYLEKLIYKFVECGDNTGYSKLNVQTIGHHF